MKLDTSSEFGQRVLKRLETEEIIWLTTIDPKGMPQPIPVWFLWHKQQIFIFSQPNTAKLRNIGQNPNVSLNFHTAPDGEDVVVLLGQAELVELPDDLLEPYLAKYANGIKGLGYTPEQMIATYSQLIRITPSKVRGF